MLQTIDWINRQCLKCRGKDDIEDVPSDQHNMYTELQTGVMPTQYQGFPLKPQTSREWTEFFTTDVLNSSMLESLLSPDYHGDAIPMADRLLENKGLSVSPQVGRDKTSLRPTCNLIDTPPVDVFESTSGSVKGQLFFVTGRPHGDV